MTVRGEGCMADTHDGSQTGGQSSATCNGHSDQHTGQRSAGSDRQTGAPSSGNTDPEADCRSRGRDSAESGASLRNSSRDSCLSRAAEVDDELPLGSEANTLRQAQGDGLAVHPPVDKRLWSLRGGGGGAGGGGGIGGGGGGGGGSQLLHSGWTSFNSDVSNLTSGSNQSASSVEWLLQERQVDPEQILLNLGFGGVLPSAPTTMYTRIPERFLHQESSATSADDDAFAEGSPAEAVPPGGRPMSRGQYLERLFGKACVSRDYRRYILSKVPDYYFIYSHTSPHSPSPPPPPPPSPCQSQKGAGPSEAGPSSAREPAGSTTTTTAALAATATSQHGDSSSSDRSSQTCVSRDVKKPRRCTEFEQATRPHTHAAAAAAASVSVSAAEVRTKSQSSPNRAARWTVDSRNDDDSKAVSSRDVGQTLENTGSSLPPAETSKTNVVTSDSPGILESPSESHFDSAGNGSSGCGGLNEASNSVGCHSDARATTPSAESSSASSPTVRADADTMSVSVHSSTNADPQSVDFRHDDSCMSESMMTLKSDVMSSSSDSAGYGDVVDESDDVTSHFANMSTPS